MATPSFFMGSEFLAFEDLLSERFPRSRACLKDEIVYGSVERSGNACFYLKKGMVNSVILHEDGGAVELTLRGKGTIFPLYHSGANTPVESVLEVRAVTDVEVIIMPKNELRALMMEVPLLALAMVDAYNKLGTYLDYCIASRLYDSLRVRICDFLHLHADETGKVLYTQEQIASAVGASRAKVSIALSSLRDEGLIRTHRGHVQISDPARLMEECSFIVRGELASGSFLPH